MLVKKKSILFSIVLLPFTLFAQTRFLEWVNPSNSLRERIDIQSSTRLVNDNNGNWITGEKITITPELLGDWQAHQEKNMSFNLNDNIIWFTINGSQRVYQFDYNSHRVERIDKTNYSGYNFNAAQFLRKDTLYSAGGYGFWQFNNLLTYYNQTVKEWELIQTKGEAPAAILGGYQGYDKALDVFYSGAGQMENIKSDIDKLYVEDLYMFDFKTLTWNQLGEINPILNFQRMREIFWTGRYFLSADQNQLFIIDPSLNKIFNYTSNKDNFHKVDKYYAKGDTLICYLDNQVAIAKFSLSDLVKRSKEVGHFYEKNNYKYLYYGLIILLLLSAIVYFLRRKIKRYQIADSVFSEQELVLVNSLCRLKQGEYLSVNDITDLLHLQMKSIENQRKIRMNLINSISNKLEQRYQLANSIIRLDDTVDKRVKMFCLSNEARDILIPLLEKR